MRRDRCCAFVAVWIPLLAAGCGDGANGPSGPNPPPGAAAVASVEVAPAVDTLHALGQMFQLVATARDAQGNAVSGVTFSWSSSAEDVATVNGSGVVTAVGNGDVQITASAGSASGSADLVVAQKAAQLAFADQPTSAEGQLPFEPAPRVEIQDALGNAMSEAGAEVKVNLVENPSGEELAGTTTVATVDGAATFADLSLALPGEGFVLEASAEGLAPAMSASFRVRLTFAQVTAGDRHSCGLTVAGFAYCWGSNEHGRLGDGTETQRPTPHPVTGGLTFARIRAGRAHSCALTAGGDAYCWGRNHTGQLGDNSLVTRFIPTPVSVGLIFADVRAGDSYSCGVTTGGEAYCWGHNDCGQLGDGTSGQFRPKPTPVATSMSFVQLSVGSCHTCGVNVQGKAFCWGQNDAGRLGTGSGDTDVPEAVSGILSFSEIDLGRAHTCGVTTGGDAHCWGSNVHGQVGDSTTTSQHKTPTPVAGGLSFAQIPAGYDHSCGLTDGGIAHCWGFNDLGQVGDGTTVTRRSPRAVSGTPRLAQMDAGRKHGCAVTSAGAAYCWGSNEFGQLGDGQTGGHSTTAQRVVQ